ncbi:DUF21 domain-containing protein [Golovinomyces cichoracearum]|uniref:DUF21 domain-containing protein n=1 Tax=Golovinomyces cichoracearum TaxID=62708 RepID=A0A420IYN1_9PEZI|nr:DUF21 domain-containing protein [Golovinomyces cichoracearum]
MMSALCSLNMTKNSKVVLNAKDSVENTGRILSETVQNSSTFFHRKVKIGMGVLAVTLLILAGISTGLILAICGLDQLSLHMKSVTATPKEREYIRAVSRLKYHGTWMLCSLVICTVACSEYFPFVIQSLFPGPPWISILISTFLITIFVELIPQFIIPARPLIWGFYCRPIIWTCMWLTALISFPTAYILSYVSKGPHSREVFTNEELKMFIKYHEKSQKNGGRLSRDASQIMLGALNLDFRCIGDFFNDKAGPKLLVTEDLEKAISPLRSKKIVTDWASVRMINIDDSVNQDFIAKVKSWSYTRLPVIGRPERHQDLGSFDPEEWESIQIYGYLHMNSLIGYNYSGKSCSLSVRDLPINPLPIVQKNISIYALLNMLEKGISKIAIIVPSQKQDSLTMMDRIPPKKLMLSQDMKHRMRQQSCNCIPSTSSIDDLVEAALMNVECYDAPSSINSGITLQRPIGLITLDDIFGAILQRTSRVEADLPNILPDIPPPKIKNPERVIRHVNHPNNIPLDEINGNKPCQRKIIKEKKGSTFDGANERNIQHYHSKSLGQKILNSRPRESYTQACGSGNSRELIPHNVGPLLSTQLSNTTTLPREKRSRNIIDRSYRFAKSGPAILPIPVNHQTAPPLCQRNLNIGIKNSYNEELLISQSSSSRSNNLVSPSRSELYVMALDPGSGKELKCKENIRKDTLTSSIGYLTQTKLGSYYYGFDISSKKQEQVNFIQNKAEITLDLKENKNSHNYHRPSVGINFNSEHERNPSSNYDCQTIPRSKRISCRITQGHNLMQHDNKYRFLIGRRLAFSDPDEYDVKCNRTTSFWA